MFFSILCYVIAITILLILWLLLPLILLDLIGKIFIIGSFLYCSYLFGSFLDTLPRFRISAKKKAVVVTGCDSGFGHLLAHRLDSIGYKVFACCLFPNDEGAQKLKNSTSGRLRILKLDVTSDEDVQKVLKEVKSSLEDCTLWAVVNNAGIALRGEAEWMPIEDYKKQFEINTFGVVRVTQAFLPLLRQTKGRVVTTTSFGGRYTFSGLVPYCMSKYAAVSYCEGLRMEMVKHGVSVVSVEPFAYKSPLTETASVLENADRTWQKLTPECREDYGGKNYIEAYKSVLKKYNDRSANPNIHEVVDVMVEAVTCTSPHYSYVVGDLKSVVGLWFIRRLPLSLASYIVRKYITFEADMEKCVKNMNKNRKNGKHL